MYNPLFMRKCNYYHMRIITTTHLPPLIIAIFKPYRRNVTFLSVTMCSMGGDYAYREADPPTPTTPTC